jgi:hypothetical protein
VIQAQIQSWATDAMKRGNEALNTSSLQFLSSIERFIATIFSER